MTRKFIVAAVAAVAINGLALAEIGTQSQSSASDRSSSSISQSSAVSPSGQSSSQLTADQFVKMAASGNEYEVQSAKLAEKQGDQHAKQMAKHIHKDHEKAQTELKSAAKKSGVTVSSTLDSKHQKMLDQLKDKQGQEFSQAFHQQQIQAHQESIDLYQRASTQLQDQDLKQYAQKQLPKLQEHLSMVQMHQNQAKGQQPLDDPQALPAGSSLPGSSNSVDIQSQPSLQPQQDPSGGMNNDAHSNQNPGTAGQGSPGSDQGPRQGGIR